MDAVDLDLALGDAHRVCIDTSSAIAYLSTTETTHRVARHLFDRIAADDDPLHGYMSVVSASEMLVRPIRAADRQLGTVTQFLREFPNLQLLDVDFEIALEAATVRVITRLALPDSLIVGTALLAGCDAIVTNDERWSRRLAPLFPQLRWIYLGR